MSSSQLQVAIYARVSSEQQATANTIESQLAALQQRVNADKFSLGTEFQFVDEGYSGATLVRPALERLRDAEQQMEGLTACMFILQIAWLVSMLIKCY